MTLIDERAAIDPGAVIGTNVEIGPYSVIGPDVVIGDDSWIGPHVVIKGPTKIGRSNRIYQFSSIGEDPQDKKYGGNEQSTLEIGDGNLIREFCSINRGSEGGGGKTVIGNDNWIMAYVHIAHDCIVGNSTIFSNNATLAGHITIDDYVILGGFTAIHQFCHIGKHCFTAGLSMVGKDVPPFLMVAGDRAKPIGLNREGLKRHGYTRETIDTLRKVYKIVYRNGLTTKQALAGLEDLASQSEVVREFSDFIEKSSRGIIR
ncbi:MAG: acyl-[acyl-carrier-protein]--UDP-N-acetylglucosamine O-acyltransferase [Gammaproteobacteria bacterium]|nr:MAG: acyl-[acyl-carrier-protein]--UDP-N-acetylglucosamine O-acyltransferase [Gammaproteobacteria bacterium]